MRYEFRRIRKEIKKLKALKASYQREERNLDTSKPSKVRPFPDQPVDEMSLMCEALKSLEPLEPYAEYLRLKPQSPSLERGEVSESMWLSAHLGRWSVLLHLLKLATVQCRDSQEPCPPEVDQLIRLAFKLNNIEYELTRSKMSLSLIEPTEGDRFDAEAHRPADLGGREVRRLILCGVRDVRGKVCHKALVTTR